MVRSKANPSRRANESETAPPAGANRKKYKHKQTYLILREIKQLQKSTKLMIPKAAFSRLVKEVMRFIRVSQEIRLSKLSMEAMHEALETYMVALFEDSYLCALHARRVTLMVKDMHLCRRLRGISDIINH